MSDRLQPGAADLAAPPLPVGQSWVVSGWFTGSVVALAFAILLNALITGASWQFVAAQSMLLSSFYLSLYILSGMPLLNPLQAGLIVFYWWFGVGPLAISTHQALLGDELSARIFQDGGLGALLIVALGLPLYALASNAVLRSLAARGWHARFLQPEGRLFSPVTTLFYCGCGFLASAGLLALKAVGAPGISTVTDLGGTRTDFWGAGVLVAAGEVTMLGASALAVHVAVLRLRAPWWLLSVGGIVCANALYGALTSGWKGPFVVLFALMLTAIVSVRQRPPFLLMLAVLVAYLAVIEPFVATGRYLAEKARARTVADRERVFSDFLAGGGLEVRGDWRSWQVASPFRSMYLLASETTGESHAFHGPWDGRTLVWTLQANVPRAIWPAKPDINTGNFFSRTVGAAVGLTSPSNAVNAAVIGVPFEFVGNFGWVPGVLSFALLGALWAAWCGWWLSPARISDHPFTPYFVVGALNFERPLDSIVATHRNLLVVLAVAFVIWIVRKRRL